MITMSNVYKRLNAYLEKEIQLVYEFLLKGQYEVYNYYTRC